MNPSASLHISASSLAPYGSTRIDRALAQLTGYSRTWIQKQIKAGHLSTSTGIGIDTCRFPPPPDTDLILTVPATPATTVEGKPLPNPFLTEASFLYEDEDLIVINKPPGLVVHPAAGHYENTLTHLLAARYGEGNLSTHAGKERAGIVHRLDRDTSGLMVIARHDLAHQRLAAQFAARTVKKHYLALVAGTLRRSIGTCSGAIGRHPTQRKKMTVVNQGGRSARTDYYVLQQAAQAALLRCELHSGRTHQIRVHLAHLGHPILGDTLYGGRRANAWIRHPIPRQMLHASHLAFDHPTRDRRITFDAEPPQDFRTLAQLLEISILSGA